MNTTELCRHLDVTPRQVQWWCEAGILSPERVAGNRQFDEDQVLLAAVVAELRRKGVGLERIRRLHAQLKKLQDEYLVLWGHGSKWCPGRTLIQCVAHAPGPCIVVSLEELRAEIWPAQKTSGSRQSPAATRTS
jgi:DNA-binding transcriptional MerR regulator